MFWKYLIVTLLNIFSWNFYYHIIYLGHKLWVEQARSCKWLTFDMILLKQSSRSLSYTIFVLQSTFQIFLVGFGHNSFYSWDHTDGKLWIWCFESVFTYLPYWRVFISCYSFRSPVVARTRKVTWMASFWHDVTWFTLLSPKFTWLVLVTCNSKNRQSCTYG